MKNPGVLKWCKWPPAWRGVAIGAVIGALITSAGYGSHLLAVRLEPGPGEGKLLVIILEGIWWAAAYPFYMA